MEHKKTYVVGNIFKDLSNQKDIITLDEAIEQIKNNNLNATSISLEQGISESQCADIKEILFNNETHKKSSVTSYFDNNVRCANKLTHKVKSHNTLISHPQQVDEDNFNSLLMIDERCAELSDHVTGKHIQFMVLVEAARQMVNAVSEKYYSDNTKIYLANKINIDFKNFVYPFHTELAYRVNEKKMKVDGNGKMLIEVDFIQWNKVACNFKMEFSIMDRKFITSIEDSALKIITNNVPRTTEAIS